MAFPGCRASAAGGSDTRPPPLSSKGLVKTWLVGRSSLPLTPWLTWWQIIVSSSPSPVRTTSSASPDRWDTVVTTIQSQPPCVKGEASDESLLSGLGQSDQDLVSPALGIRSRIVCRQVLLHPTGCAPHHLSRSQQNNSWRAKLFLPSELNFCWLCRPFQLYYTTFHPLLYKSVS